MDPDTNCLALTKKGLKCQYKAKKNGYCGIHYKKIGGKPSQKKNKQITKFKKMLCTIFSINFIYEPFPIKKTIKFLANS